jgi:hypothetical protein
LIFDSADAQSNFLFFVVFCVCWVAQNLFIGVEKRRWCLPPFFVATLPHLRVGTRRQEQRERREEHEGAHFDSIFDR